MKKNRNIFLFITLIFVSIFAQAQGDEKADGAKPVASESQPLEVPPAPQDPVEKSPSAKAGPSHSGVEKIQVTGSHIKRVDVEGPSPVVTLDKDYLDKSGYNSLSDVLRDLPVSSFGGDRENALNGGAYAGAGTTSLRGFGSDAILVLLDGKRLPAIGGSSSIDLNLIPKSAVERVEILKDGASAIYGSDALGGVINVITKKDYDGANIEVGYTLPEMAGGARTDLKASYGTTGAKHSVMGVLQYRSNEATLSRDRDFTRVGLNQDAMSATGSPGSYRPVVTDSSGEKTARDWVAGSAADPCPSGFVLDGDGRCGFDYSEFSQITPKMDQYSALLSGTYEINESLSVYSRAFYTRRNVRGMLAPSPDTLKDDSGTGRPNYLVSQSILNDWGLPTPPINGGDTLLGYDIRYRLVDEAGPRINEVETDSFSVQAGINGYMGDTWEWEFSASYGASDTSNLGVSGYADKSVIFAGIQNDANFFNPFAANKSDISSAFYVPKEIVKSSVSTIQVSATGELGNFLAGPLALAVGASTSWQTYEQFSDTITNAGNQWGGGTASAGQGLRDFQSVYGEMSSMLFQNFEAQLALRMDHFSDFGSTVNPKVAFRYNPVKMLMFRGSWGTGFKAPALEELYSGDNINFPFGLDPATGFVGQFQSLEKGNRNLKEETSESLNLGFVLEPMNQLSLTVDYWQTKQDSAISQHRLRDLFEAESQFGNDFLIANYGIDVQRVNGGVDKLVLPYINLSKRDVEGLDVSLAYALPLFLDWKFNLGIQHAVLLKYLVQPFPGLDFEDRAGFYGNPRWRNTSGLGISNPIFSIGLSFRTIGEQDFSRESPGFKGKTRDHTEADLRLGYRGHWGGTLSGGVRNLFGTDRPWQKEYSNAGFVNGSVYDPIGRAYYMTYSQDF